MSEKRINNKYLVTLLCFLLGALWLIAVRFALLEKKEVHYHANFGVFIDGQREEFKNFTYYEEIQACFDDGSGNPKARTHMHDNVGHVVHIHDEGVTWGHFFANLGWVLGPDFIETRDGMFITDKDGKKLNLELNGATMEGAKATDLYNTTIKSEDVLLISYGSEDEDGLKAQYEQITKDASEYNKRNDPSSCTGGKPLTFSERLKTALKFWE